MTAHSSFPLADKVVGWVDGLRRRENRLALVLSLLIGALVGLVVVAFILLTGRLAAHMYPAGGAGWRRILVPTLGSLVTGYLLFRFFPDARGSGIPKPSRRVHPRRPNHLPDRRRQVRLLFSLARQWHRARPRRARGAHRGRARLGDRSPPRAQHGAGQGSGPGRRSAALAAAFNTPIAAVLFSLEEIMGDLHAPILGSVVLSSTTSWMVLHLVLGDEPLFHVAGYHLVSPIEFLRLRRARHRRRPRLGGVRQAAARLAAAVSATCPRCDRVVPAGGGRPHGRPARLLRARRCSASATIRSRRCLSGDMVLQVVVMLAVLKIVATAVCYASGNAGGIFGPSLFIGAMIGARGGQRRASRCSRTSTAGPGAYALVGMGTAFAGIIRTPLTSVIMIFEVTRDYTIIVPLMISNLIAFYISQQLQHEPIYEALARQDGIHLPTEEHRFTARRLRVTAAMRSAANETLASQNRGHERADPNP